MRHGIHPDWKVTREDVLAVPTPGAVGRHRPLSHGQFLETLEKSAQEAGVVLGTPTFGLISKGKRLLALYPVEALPAGPDGPGAAVPFGFRLVARNAHDKWYRVGLSGAVALGAPLPIAFWPFRDDMTMKHTPHLASELAGFFGSHMQGIEEIIRDVGQDRQAMDTWRWAKDVNGIDTFLIRTVAGGLIGAQRLSRVLESPNYPNVQTVWDLFCVYMDTILTSGPEWMLDESRKFVQAFVQYARTNDLDVVAQAAS